MPQAYRFEISPNGRAGCQNKECKDAKLKITKGELRFGTWVEFTMGEREVQSWKWRHWSCITPTVIQNVQNALGGLEAIEGDPEVIDGYDEMPEEWQEKILTMFREGHVPDEDWKGDVEQNRPGKRGSHKKAKSAKKKAEENENEAAADLESTPTKAKAAKGRGKKTKTEGNSDDDVPVRRRGPAAKKRKAGPVADDDDDDELDLHPAKTENTSRRRKSGQNDIKAPAPEEKPAKKSRAKKAKVEATPDEQVVEPADDGPSERPTRAPRKARKVKNDDVGLKKEDTESSPQAVKVEQVDGAADSTISAPAGKKKRSRKVKTEDAVEDDAGITADPAELALKNEVEEETHEEGEEAAAVGPTQTETLDPNPTTAKVGGARKKGVAKTLPKGRPRPDY